MAASKGQGMAISGDYPNPVTVNGYSCRNCTDVDYAKKHIDPAHPKDGPYGIDAQAGRNPASPAVTFGGSLVGLNTADGAAPPARARPLLDISA